MPLIFEKDNKFEDLGSLEEFLSSYGDCLVSIDDINEPNIRLTIVSEQEIEFKILCSNPLSKIIQENGGFPEVIEMYRIIRIKKKDGGSYIRVSQSINIDVSKPNSEVEKLKNTVKGNIIYSFKIESLKK
jgi:hypothetical protein